MKHPVLIFQQSLLSRVVLLEDILTDLLLKLDLPTTQQHQIISLILEMVQETTKVKFVVLEVVVWPM